MPTTRATLQAKVRTGFAGTIEAGDGITVTQAGTVWTVSLDTNFYDTFTPGAVLYADDPGGTVTGLPPVATGSVLKSGTIPSWGNVDLTTEVTGTLPVANGGTGVTSLSNLTLASFGATTSAQLAGVISDETGSGALVFASAPTLTSPVVGTQSVGDSSTKAASTAFVAANTVASLNAQTGALILQPAPTGRLSASASTALPTADIVGATSISFHPGASNTIPIWDGTRYVPRALTAVITLSLDNNSGHTGYHQVSKAFTVWAYWTGSAVGIGTGPAWTSLTSPGTGAGTNEEELIQGVIVNKVTITLRIGTASGDTVSVSARQAIAVGGFVTLGGDGQTEDSLLNRMVSSLYDLEIRPMVFSQATDSWTYTTAAFRKWNNVSSLVSWFHYGSGHQVFGSVAGLCLNSDSTVTTAGVGIGLDSFTVNSATRMQATGYTDTHIGAPRAEYLGFPGRGFHFFVPLEYGPGGADTTTWYGDAGVATIYQTGLLAWTAL